MGHFRACSKRDTHADCNLRSQSINPEKIGSEEYPNSSITCTWQQETENDDGEVVPAHCAEFHSVYGSDNVLAISIVCSALAIFGLYWCWCCWRKHKDNVARGLVSVVSA